MSRHPIGWVIALAGLWKLIAAFALDYSVVPSALWNAVIAGVLLIGFGIWLALAADHHTAMRLYWVNTVLGVWVFIAPWVLGYSVLSNAVSNDVLVGGVVAALAGWFGLFIGPRFTRPV